MKGNLLCLGCLLIALMFSACGGGSGQAAYSVPEISALPPDEQPAEIYERYYEEEFVDALRPAADYGQLYPYIGKVIAVPDEEYSFYRYGLADEQGRIVVDPVYASASYTTNGPEEGALYLEISYPLAQDDEEALELLVASGYWIERRNFQFATADGAWISPLYYGNYASLDGDRVIVGFDSEPPRDDGFTEHVWRLYDLQGNLLAEGKGSLESFADGLSLCTHYYHRDGQNHEEYYYIDRDGRVAISGPFADAYGFQNGRASVLLQNSSPQVDDGYSLSYAVIDTAGNYLVEPKPLGDMISFRFSGSDDYAEIRQNSLYGLIDREGNIVLPAEYEWVYPHTVPARYRYEHPESVRELTPRAAAVKPDGSAWLINLQDGSEERLEDNLHAIGILPDGWILAKKMTPKTEEGQAIFRRQQLGWVLFNGEQRYFFAEQDYYGMGCEYIKGGLLAFTRQNWEIGFSTILFDINTGKTLQSWDGWAYSRFFASPASGHTLYYFSDRDFNTLVLNQQFEPQFETIETSTFSGFSHLSGGIYSAQTGQYSGLLREDGSWLLRVNINAGE